MGKTNPLKWQGIEALTAHGLRQFKLPGKLGGAPVFYLTSAEIVPFFVFTPHLKWGAVNTAGLLGLSFRDIDAFVDSVGKSGTWPSFMMHTANFPGDLSRYIDPEEAESGIFNSWAAEIAACLRNYPTSAGEFAIQVGQGRLGGFRADQQFTAWAPNEGLASWLALHQVAIPPPASLPLQAVSVPSAIPQ